MYVYNKTLMYTPTMVYSDVGTLSRHNLLITLQFHLSNLPYSDIKLIKLN